MSRPRPYSAPGTLSADDAGELARRARKALRRGLLTHRQLVLFETLLWSCRKPGAAEAIASYTRMEDLAHMSRETISKAITRLGELRLMKKIKHRALFVWGNRIASRQATSSYRFEPAGTEFGEATVILDSRIIYCAPTAETRQAQMAIAAWAEQRTQFLAQQGALKGTL